LTNLVGDKSVGEKFGCTGISVGEFRLAENRLAGIRAFRRSRNHVVRWGPSNRYIIRLHRKKTPTFSGEFFREFWREFGGRESVGGLILGRIRLAANRLAMRFGWRLNSVGEFGWRESVAHKKLNFS